MLIRNFTLSTIIILVSLSLCYSQKTDNFGISPSNNYQTQALAIESVAPDFISKDQYGKEIQLKTMVKEGPVVLIFYRGEWCGYCNKALSEYEENLSSLSSVGAHIIAITPETSENRNLSIEKSNVSFPILIDTDQSIMSNYGVAFEVSDNYQNKLFNYTNKALSEYNHGNTTVLPIPATYIIDQNQIVRWVHFDPDYSKRASITEIMAELSKL